MEIQEAVINQLELCIGDSFYASAIAGICHKPDDYWFGVGYNKYAPGKGEDDWWMSSPKKYTLTIVAFSGLDTSTVPIRDDTPLGTKDAAVFCLDRDENIIDALIKRDAITVSAPIIAGEIIESYWRLTAEEIPHPHSDPIPRYAGYYMCFKIRNTGNTTTSFRMAYYIPPPEFGAGWYYSKPITLNPGQEGLIEWVFYAGAKPGAYTVTWYLFGDDIEVDSITITNYIS